MEQYIVELIKSNNRIIIPGFGAFLIARERGYTVLFNNFLNFNDGLLAAYIAQKEGITTDQANEQIEQYVSLVKERLHSEGNYTIAQLGTFTRDANNNFHFEQNSFLNTEKNSASIEPSAQKSVEEDEYLLNIDQNATGFETEEQPISIAKTQLSSNLMDDPLIELQPVAKKREGNQENSIKSRKTMSTPHKDNKKSSWLWILIPISIFLIFAVYYLFFRPGTKAPQPTAQGEPSMIIDTLAQQEPPVESEQTTSMPAIAPSKAFHIIVGSYKTPAQAQDFISQLKNKGYNNATFFARGNWFVVSIESLPTLPEAESVQEEILDRDRIESWIVDIK